MGSGRSPLRPSWPSWAMPAGSPAPTPRRRFWPAVGTPRRFAGGDQVVRATGLDITVYASDGKRSPGHLSRQGPEVLRWALFEAANAAARPRSPDYPYSQQVKARQGGNRATLAVARKLARRVRHTLASLGDAALVPVEGRAVAE